MYLNSFLPHCKKIQVDQTPLPLLFMRTVIQAVDAFPALVNLFFNFFDIHALLLFVIHFLSVKMYYFISGMNEL
jgi:hypothetical protein